MLDARTSRCIGGLALGAALVLAGVTSESRAQQQAGFEAHVDPDTGEFVEPPVRLPRSSTTLGESESAPEMLELQEEPTPAGGVTVELRGAFRSTVRATVDAGGKVDANCDGGGTSETGKASE